MKPAQIKLNVFILLWIGFAPLSEAAKKVLTPTLNNKKVQLKTGELKPTLYYALSKKYATVLRIGGPGEVTIFLRTKMQEDEASDSKYHLRYVLDGKIVKVKPVGSSKASKKTLVVGKSYRVSVVKKVQIIIPPGKHRLEVFSLNDERLVFSKYYFEKHVKPKWKVKQPINNMEATSLTTVESKKVLNYYRIDSENGMKIEMDENTYLRLLVRVEFKHSMFSDNEMRIQMKENGKVVYTFKVSSVRSKYVVYTEGGKLIPGTLNKIYIRVPEGKHKYEFVVADKSKTALIKASYDKLRFPTNSNVPISNP